MDKYSPQVRKKMMKAVKSKGSRIESICATEFRSKGMYFRRNVTTLTGKPDFALKKYRIVIFVDSCFWHGCPLHLRMPKSNKEFWTKKIERNMTRDKEVTAEYEKAGWSIFRIWEHDVYDPETLDKFSWELVATINSCRK